MLSAFACAFVVLAEDQAPPPKVLFLTQSKGFKHSVVTRKSEKELSHAEKQLIEIGKGAFEVIATQDAADITPENLRKVKAVFFYTTGELPISDANKKVLLEWIRAGGGFGGFHCATDTLYNWAEYGGLLGGYFDGHPWHEKIKVVVEDQKFPATAQLGASFEITDEIYQFRNWDRSKVHVLLSMDKGHPTIDKGKRADKDYALAWTLEYGRGRVFYCALGHREEVWTDPRFQKIARGGVLWTIHEAKPAEEQKKPSGFRFQK